MKEVYFFSKLFHWGTRVLAIVYAMVFLYSVFVLTIKTSELQILDNGKRFEIFFPFTQQPFLLGYYNTLFILIEFLLVLSCYGIFFWLLSKVFYVFTQEKLFTQKAYNHLKRFYIANLFVPVIILTLLEISSYIEREDMIFVAFHFLLGIFTFFLATIFKKGLALQNNQDLII